MAGLASPGRHLNPGTTEQKVGVLISRLRPLVLVPQV
jgi:hypothetical protein